MIEYHLDTKYLKFIELEEEPTWQELLDSLPDVPIIEYWRSIYEEGYTSNGS
jgi:hypothetical protein